MKFFHKKSNLLICLLFLLAAIFFVILFSKIEYLFSPDYVEFGPLVSLYNSKSCVDLTTGNFQEDCLIYGRSVSTSYSNPTIVYDAVNQVLHDCDIDSNQCGQTGKEMLSRYSKDPDRWQCSENNIIVSDLRNTKTGAKSHYYCWPK